MSSSSAAGPGVFGLASRRWFRTAVPSSPRPWRERLALVGLGAGLTCLVGQESLRLGALSAFVACGAVLVLLPLILRTREHLVVTDREEAHRAMLLTLQHQATAVERLQELERVKGDFVSTVSHELRTPITSIIGYAELLEDDLAGELSRPQREIIDRMERNGRRLLLLVEDLLTLSQIESSAMRIDPEVTDLRTVLSAAREAIAPVLAHRRLDLDVAVPAEPVVHHGDPVQLERVVTNLLTNAVKFTPDGGTVEVSLTSRGESSEIVVRDDGCGIPETEQARLFTRFFRSSTATARAIQGTGLGLTIVQAIVALHGGRIDVTSAHEQGTTVRVTLPRVAQAVPISGTVVVGAGVG